MRPGRRPVRALAILAPVALLLGACGAAAPPSPPGRPTIVVTYSVLGALVRDLVGDAAKVVVLIPNGADPHEWEPSARDIEAVVHADLLVENGLGLEGGLANAFTQAERAGVRRFVVTDHVTLRTVGSGEGVSAFDPDQKTGAPDPHVWMDPLTMRDAMDALAVVLRQDLGIDVGSRAADLGQRLAALNERIAAVVAPIPPGRRTLVTGHESLGYFARRYGLTLVGAIIPSLTTSAAPSAADLSSLATTIRSLGVPAIFSELGTSPAVAEAIGRETGTKVVELATHTLPADGTYDTFLADMASLIAENLR
jgi:zinc/manganese transport system substrate-binding protein